VDSKRGQVFGRVTMVRALLPFGKRHRGRTQVYEAVDCAGRLTLTRVGGARGVRAHRCT